MVQGQVIDFGEREIKARKMTTTGRGPSSLGFTNIGCPASAGGSKVEYCAQGSPLSLFQVTSSGESRPVSSRSPVGFQDASIGPKPPCSAANRSTFYVEKGSDNDADKPLLCVKDSKNNYYWIQLSMVP